MIILSNGDKWIIDDSEWEEAGIEYEEACKGNIPVTTVEDFVDKLINGDVGLMIPRKLTDYFPEGYWDGNLDAKIEVLRDAAVKTITNEWSYVHEMPWGHVIVAARAESEDGEGEYISSLTKFENVEDYMRAVTFLYSNGYYK